MESLALMAVVVMLSLWGLAGSCLLVSFVGFRTLGAVLGFLSMLAGVWLLFILPHAPLLGLVNVVAGAVATRRRFGRENK